VRPRPLIHSLQVALILAVSVAGVGTPARAQHRVDGDQPSEWSLEEIRDKRRVFLLAARSRVVDVRGHDPSAVLEAAAGGKVRMHFYPYRIIARKLNEYIRKGRGMSAVENASEADYVVYFNVLEYRRTLNGVYPYGELFVILNRGADG
jgi:hypothetical protein